LTIKFTHEQQIPDAFPFQISNSRSEISDTETSFSRANLTSLFYFLYCACTVKLALCVFFADITPQQSQISNCKSEIISTPSEEAYFSKKQCVTSDNSHYSIVKDLLLLSTDASKLQHSNWPAWDVYYRTSACRF